MNIIFFVFFFICLYSVYTFVFQRRAEKHFLAATQNIRQYLEDANITNESKKGAYAIFSLFTSFKSVIIMPFISCYIFYCVFLSKREPKKIKKEDINSNYKICAKESLLYFITRWPIENIFSLLISVFLFIFLLILYLVFGILICIIRASVVSFFIGKSRRVKFLDLVKYSFML